MSRSLRVKLTAPPHESGPYGAGPVIEVMLNRLASRIHRR